MRGKKKKVPTRGPLRAGCAACWAPALGFWGSHKRSRSLCAGLNGPQATAGGPSLTIFTHPAHHDRTIAAPAGRPLREPCRPGVSATGGPRRGRKAYQTPNWRPGLRLGAPLDGLCGRLAHRYRYHQKQREISSRRAPASTAVLATGGAAFSSRGP